MSRWRVDINCDMGEGYGVWQLGEDEALLPHISSANIACGFHAGDASVMRRTVRAAAARGVAIGAHPGLPDRAGFGRRRMQVTPEEIYDICVYQIGALLGHARAAGVPLAHVKPHGALYNMAAADRALAAAVAAAVHDVDNALTLFGLAGSVLVSEGERAGLLVAAEAFADRAYEPDGSLTPRDRPGAVIADPAAAADRALRMVVDGVVATSAGTDFDLVADTICVHGDSPHAVRIARKLRAVLESAGVRIAAPGQP
ncbi:MAG: 5-oxoprolinase subunit PxpA [Gemmatimonadota bacterium]